MGINPSLTGKASLLDKNIIAEQSSVMNGPMCRRTGIWSRRWIALGMWCVLTGFAVAQPVGRTTSSEADLIRQVRIEGNEHVAESTILSQIKSRPGAVFSEKIVSDDARRIIVMPQVYDVKWRAEPGAEGIDLVFVVAETPQVESVKFLGNKKLSVADLEKVLKFAAGDFVDRYLIRSGAEALAKTYHEKGYYFATVKLNEDLLKTEKQVVYTIVEGPKLRVKKVKFEGNDTFGDGQLKGKI